jgi:hypothetical protein
MADKIYCGNGRIKNFGNGGSIINITVDLDTLNREFAEYGFNTDQGKKKIKLIVGERREVDQYGNSHHVTVDTWKPDGQQNGAVNVNSVPASVHEEFEDEIPI